MSSRRSPASTDAPATVDVARRFTEEVWNGRDDGVVPDLVHRDYVLDDPAVADPIRGREALDRHVRDSVRAFSDRHVGPRLGLGEGEMVMAYYTTTGTFDGAYGPLSPTGRRVAVDGTAVIRYEDGKLREEFLYYDTVDFRKQLGVTGVGFLRQVPSIVRWSLRTARERLLG